MIWSPDHWVPAVANIAETDVAVAQPSPTGNHRDCDIRIPIVFGVNRYIAQVNRELCSAEIGAICRLNIIVSTSIRFYKATNVIGKGMRSASINRLIHIASNGRFRIIRLVNDVINRAALRFAFDDTLWILQSINIRRSRH